jgi:hypothetical protein
MTAPTIGRIVIYQPQPGENGAHAGSLWPAIVTSVQSAGPAFVNLHVFRDNMSGSLSVPGVVEGTTPGTWRWPDRVE